MDEDLNINEIQIIDIVEKKEPEDADNAAMATDALNRGDVQDEDAPNGGDTQEDGNAPNAESAQPAPAEAAQPKTAKDAGEAAPALIAESEARDAVHDKIRISDDVLTQIITIAAGRIPGVSIPSASVGDGIAGLLGMKGATRGIKLDSDDNNIAVDIFIAVEYGYRISDAAKRLQDEIRGDLTELTGINVTQVNVHVISLSTKEQPAAKSARPAKQQKEQAADVQETGGAQPQAAAQSGDKSK